MAKNSIKLEMSGFEELLTELDKLDGDLKEVVTDALEQAAETIEWDTKDAMKKAHLPASGKYSKGVTEKSIVSNAKVDWQGTMAEINAGFDFHKDGVGGILIVGTPRMKPNRQLQKIYKQKRYMSQIVSDMKEIVSDAIEEKLGG